MTDTTYVCPKHGDIGQDVIDIGAVFETYSYATSDDLGRHALPEHLKPRNRLICQRCAKALFDDQFLPVKERPAKD